MSNNSLENARKIINEVDAEMARLFEKRMEAVKDIAQYKAELGLPVFDPEREKAIVERCSSLIESEKIREYYVKLIKQNMSLSRAFQEKIISDMSTDKSITKIRVEASTRYDVSVGRGILAIADQIFDLGRRVLIITDSGVPKEYAKTVKNLSSEAIIVTVPEGEASKSIETYSKILSEMARLGMTRTDCVVAVGGGVVGDLAGFVSASYMRGIDFYNIPTTLLSQVDSSIGGKCAVNLDGIKNIVGAFYQPKAVLIDPDTIKTLPKRQISNGLAEAIKMAATSDRELFEFMEKCEMNDEDIEKIIVGSLKIKKSVVEADEREGGPRRVLNFGHTLGHAIESAGGMSVLYHGECVGIGMLYASAPEARERINALLKKCGLPTEYSRVNEVLDFVNHDKKLEGKSLSCVLVDEIGSFNIKKMTTDEFAKIIKEGYTK